MTLAEVRIEWSARFFLNTGFATDPGSVVAAGVAPDGTCLVHHGLRLSSMDRMKGLAGALDVASQGQGALAQPGVPDVQSETPNSLVVQRNSPSIHSTKPAVARDVDLSLYEPIASPRTHQAGKILMAAFGAIAALLVVGFGVVMLAGTLPNTISEFFK